MTDPIDQFGPVMDLETSFPPTATLQQQRGADLLEQQRALVAMGRRAIAPPDLPILLQDAADLLADVLGMQYSLVAELSPDGPALGGVCGCHTHPPRGGTDSCPTDGRPPQLRLALRRTGTAKVNDPVCETSTTGADSLAGYALQVAHPVVVADLSQEKRFVDAFLRKHGICSAIAVPLKLQDRSFGSLAACSREKRYFDDEDLLFVETVAHLVTAAIGRSQAEKSLADERRLATGVLQTVDALVLVLDGQGQIVSINSACQRLTGFSLEEIKGRHVWNVFSVAKEVEMCRRLLEQLREQKSLVEYESYLLTKHSEQRQIAWSCSAIADDDGTLESIITTGVDITEQRRAQEEAERAVRAAEQARQVMARALLAAERQGVQLRATWNEEPPTADGPQTATGPGGLPPHVLVERRRHPRRPFPYKQRIAAVVDGKLPDRQTFVDVQCKDIAASGFSFLSPKPPSSDTLVVALGVPPKVTYLVAQVVHVTRVEKRGQRKFLIGCSYVGRAAYGHQTPSGRG
jgi:PAS domain S-box-containing protein